jgi:hypothetical protein
VASGSVGRSDVADIHPKEDVMDDRDVRSGGGLSDEQIAAAKRRQAAATPLDRQIEKLDEIIALAREGHPDDENLLRDLGDLRSLLKDPPDARLMPPDNRSHFRQ